MGNLFLSGALKENEVKLVLYENGQSIEINNEMFVQGCYILAARLSNILLETDVLGKEHFVMYVSEVKYPKIYIYGAWHYSGYTKTLLIIPISEPKGEALLRKYYSYNGYTWREEGDSAQHVWSYDQTDVRKKAIYVRSSLGPSDPVKFCPVVYSIDYSAFYFGPNKDLVNY